MSAVAYWILQNIIVASQGEDSLLKKAIARDFKGKASPILYTIGIALSFYSEWFSVGVYAFVAIMWLVPDKRIERTIAHTED